MALAMPPPVYGDKPDYTELYVRVKPRRRPARRRSGAAAVRVATPRRRVLHQTLFAAGHAPCGDGVDLYVDFTAQFLFFDVVRRPSGNPRPSWRSREFLQESSDAPKNLYVRGRGSPVVARPAGRQRRLRRGRAPERDEHAAGGAARRGAHAVWHGDNGAAASGGLGPPAQEEAAAAAARPGAVRDAGARRGAAVTSARVLPRMRRHLYCRAAAAPRVPRGFSAVRQGAPSGLSRAKRPVRVAPLLVLRRVVAGPRESPREVARARAAPPRRRNRRKEARGRREMKEAALAN